MPSSRRFPPPCSVEEVDAHLIVKDSIVKDSGVRGCARGRQIERICLGRPQYATRCGG
jgi:hypothetical protein